MVSLHKKRHPTASRRACFLLNLTNYNLNTNQIRLAKIIFHLHSFKIEGLNHERIKINYYLGLQVPQVVYPCDVRSLIEPVYSFLFFALIVDIDEQEEEWIFFDLVLRI